MKYKVINIQEDVDYGCEERDVVLAVVTLEDREGNQIIRKDPDQELYDKNIEIGSEVIIDENDTLQPVLDDDWTKNCTPATVDLRKFTDMMTRVKAGEEIDWICPFCGGKVRRLEQTGGKTVIGCENCDMRITLEG